MTIYVCKTCGRAMIASGKPNFCYADRMDTIENISNEDAVKMGLFSDCRTQSIFDSIYIEFPLDYRFNPKTGEEALPGNYEIAPADSGSRTLSEFQDLIMERVRNG